MRYNVLLLLLLNIASASTALAQRQSMNMTMFDRFTPNVSKEGTHSALWGYTGPDGREYALFGAQDGVHIVDISVVPVRTVAYIWGPTNSWREIKVYKQFAYIVSESSDSGGGLQIVDLSQLPNAATLVRTDTSFFIRGHTLYVRDNYLYVMGTQPVSGANGGAIILDLEPDPIHPRKVGQVDPHYFHDAWVRNDTLLGAAMFNGGCDIYDVRDKAAPVYLASIRYPFSGTHNCEITTDGRYAMTTDEIGLTPKTLKVWDIRDLENITKVAEYTPHVADVVHNVHVLGRYAIVSWYTAGVRILDMIDPTHPREVGFFDTYPGPSGGFNGVWEVYPYFASGKIIASDRQSGLYVWTFNNAIAGSVSGTVRNAATGNPMPGVHVIVPETGRTVVSDAQGRYYVGWVKGETLTLVTREFGFGGTSQPVTLAGDLQQDILLTPLQKVTVSISARDEQGATIQQFSYAVEPHITSTTADNGAATVMLPRDSTYTITVGKWGYAQQQITVTAGVDAQAQVTLQRKYIDDATLDLGWSYQTPGDSVTRGGWRRTQAYPTASPSDWLFPPSQPGGVSGYVFMTGPEPPSAPANFHDLNGRTTLTTPPMDLTTYDDPSIWYDLWSVHFKKDTVRDTLLVQLSNDDGASWVTTYSEVEGTPGWSRHVIFIKDFMQLSTRMRVRFIASDTLGSATVAAAVDDFEVNASHASGVVKGEKGEGERGMVIAVSPNPVRSGGEVRVALAEGSRQMRVEMFNSSGERIAVLHDGALDAGVHGFAIDPALSAGGYTLWFTDGGGKTGSYRIVVVR